MPDQLECFLDESVIQNRVREMALQIREDYGNAHLVLIGVLKGSLFFLADLSRHLGLEVSMDFIQVSSYGMEKSSSGVVQIRKDLDQNIEGKHVLIVEDIVDTGLTLDHLKSLLATRSPKSLKVVSLLSKPEARKFETLVDYLGFEIPNKFVVGYGLDYAERYRNLPYIAILHESA
ncbi:MAG: hypoxanthine phosphoribosyltransferase [Armatimonadetes bacterium]|nr:hypoxanthine phosphoribosyltransferase [Armatimonadota bacterium]